MNTPKLLESKYQAGFGVIILGQNSQTFMIPLYSTTILYDIALTTVVNIPEPVQYKIYALALPFDLRCESGTCFEITCFSYEIICFRKIFIRFDKSRNKASNQQKLYINYLTWLWRVQ